MTYLVAIKCGRSVILTADTAITTKHPFAPPTNWNPKRTSFDEPSISEPRRSVEEKMVKVFNLNKAAIAFCGNLKAAEDVIEGFAFALIGRDDVREALEICLSTLRKSSPGEVATFAVGFPSSHGASLLTFNTKEWTISEHASDGILQFGSMPCEFKEQTKRWMEYFAPEMKERPDRLLAVTLGILQSYGIYTSLLDDHVGGAFCGLSIDSSGVKWQDDILYAIHADPSTPVGFVHCAIRDNVFVVNSSLIDECRHFVGRINCPDLSSWKRRWWDVAFAEVAKAAFGFVTFINKQVRITTVVEMTGKRESKDIQFRPSGGSGTSEPLYLNLSTSAKVTRHLTTPLATDGSKWKFVWLPFAPYNEFQD